MSPEELASILDALGHPLRLRIVSVLMEGEMYLSEIAARLGVSRALTKIHLKKLERAGLVESRVVVVEGEAKAHRFYRLKDFDIRVNPEEIRRVVGGGG